MIVSAPVQRTSYNDLTDCTANAQVSCVCGAANPTKRGGAAMFPASPSWVLQSAPPWDVRLRSPVVIMVPRDQHLNMFARPRRVWIRRQQDPYSHSPLAPIFCVSQRRAVEAGSTPDLVRQPKKEHLQQREHSSQHCGLGQSHLYRGSGTNRVTGGGQQACGS